MSVATRRGKSDTRTVTNEDHINKGLKKTEIIISKPRKIMYMKMLSLTSELLTEG